MHALAIATARVSGHARNARDLHAIYPLQQLSKSTKQCPSRYLTRVQPCTRGPRGYHDSRLRLQSTCICLRLSPMEPMNVCRAC